MKKCDCLDRPPSRTLVPVHLWLSSFITCVCFISAAVKRKQDDEIFSPGVRNTSQDVPMSTIESREQTCIYDVLECEIHPSPVMNAVNGECHDSVAVVNTMNEERDVTDAREFLS